MGDTTMTEQWTPTTEHVRATFAYITAGLDHDDGYAFDVTPRAEDFDRWLAAHDAEVAANALRKAGRILEAEVLIGGDAHVLVSQVTASLNKRADRIEREANNQKTNGGIGEGSDA